MRVVAAVFAPFLLLLAGCLSAPIAQELVDGAPVPPPEPLRTQEIVRLSNAGISEEVIVGLIRTRGVADRPSVAQIARLPLAIRVRATLVASPAEAPARKPAPRIVYRELWIPLWPSYSGGRWHLGLRIGCYYRTVPELVPEIVLPEPELPESPPPFIDP